MRNFYGSTNTEIGPAFAIESYSTNSYDRIREFFEKYPVSVSAAAESSRLNSRWTYYSTTGVNVLLHFGRSRSKRR
jgi:hypothetical protein